MMNNFALIGAAGYIASRHMKAIKETGFQGYVAQEFIPRDKTNFGINSLTKAVEICDV